MRIVSLLEQCDGHHSKYRSSHPPRRPTRLLRIGIDQQSNQLYVYLDTGSDQEHKLTVSLFKTLRIELAVSELPRILQDAFLSSWNHDVRFIWMNYLCIFQNNEKDLAREIADLPAISDNAHITIPASGADDSRDNFLNRTSRSPVQGIVWSLSYACTDGIYTIAADFRIHVIWARMDVSRDGTASRRGVRSWEDMHQLFLSLYRGIKEGSDVKECEIWMKLVWNDSRRALKCPADKIPATSGIADLWSRRMLNDTCLAGLWHYQIPLALLWICDQQSEQLDDTYRTPSWKSASLKGLATWNRAMITDIDPELEVVASNIKLVHVELPYGAVASGSLTVQGHFCRGIPSLSAPNCLDSEYIGGKSFAPIDLLSDSSESTLPVVM
ncbi:hypothetical protein COCMIDRAFT_3613 [Bipolaris oryzae ATCC 44560]|uniref:Heterokaryon incompatibility domain-containing protein n=1 Tax=Bipolaris oryzae ATCC 44560 TaxID=930090 RepID=W6ZIW3_COCMI|nr:uncharacterized protein COCMIDRAFT_3613 [Bipolaris oryzae ATCC 44560]EUC47354.1 hypothetical protein COCMIDRAFT_3613 [Bipolaris oryzae ATCC 44560]